MFLEEGAVPWPQSQVSGLTKPQQPPLCSAPWAGPTRVTFPAQGTTQGASLSYTGLGLFPPGAGIHSVQVAVEACHRFPSHSIPCSRNRTTGCPKYSPGIDKVPRNIQKRRWQQRWLLLPSWYSYLSSICQENGRKQARSQAHRLPGCPVKGLSPAATASLFLF